MGRQRRWFGCFALVGILGALALGLTMASAQETPRAQMQLWKLCPGRANNPSFQITNMTNVPDGSDPQWAPQTLTFWITRGDQKTAAHLYTATIAPGQVMTVTLTGQPWQGPFFAQFMSRYRGVTKLRLDKEYCTCENPPDTTTSTEPPVPTTTTTVPPTTTTSAPTATATTTVPLPTTTTTAPYGGAPSTTIPQT